MTKKIIFIQGIHNFSFRNKLVFNALKTMGFQVIHFPMFYSVHQTKKHLDLIDTINTFLEKEDGEFMLFGHSFGGVVAYSLKDDHYKKITKIVTIASPHQVKFRWFKKILHALPYKVTVDVPKQVSYGFLFDITVPFIFTKHSNSQSHHNLIGTHNYILNSRSLIKKLV